MSARPQTPWFVNAFRADYLDLYAHRDEASAAREAKCALSLMRHDPQAGFLLQDLLNRTSHDSLLPAWARVLDRAGHVRKLARTVLADGRVTPDEVRALVDEAENDFFVISGSERRALQHMLDEHGDRFDPSAREALAAFLVWKQDDGADR